jgi:hypothetical protein
MLGSREWLPVGACWLLGFSGSVRFVEIVMIEKLNCILSKRATRPVYI